MFNKSQSIPIGTCFFWFIFTLPFETSGTASCGTTGMKTCIEIQVSNLHQAKKNSEMMRMELYSVQKRERVSTVAECLNVFTQLHYCIKVHHIATYSIWHYHCIIRESTSNPSALTSIIFLNSFITASAQKANTFLMHNAQRTARRHQTHLTWNPGIRACVTCASFRIIT